MPALVRRLFVRTEGRRNPSGFYRLGRHL